MGACRLGVFPSVVVDDKSVPGHLVFLRGGKYSVTRPSLESMGRHMRLTYVAGSFPLECLWAAVALSVRKMPPLTEPMGSLLTAGNLHRLSYPVGRLLVRANRSLGWLLERRQRQRLRTAPSQKRHQDSQRVARGASGDSPRVL